MIECLVGSDGHHNLVSDTQEKEAALRQVESHLTDDLIEALREELLTHWADSTLSGLALHELLIEHLTKAGHIDSRSWLVTNVLDPMLALNEKKDDISSHHEIQISSQSVT